MCTKPQEMEPPQKDIPMRPKRGTNVDLPESHAIDHVEEHREPKDSSG